MLIALFSDIHGNLPALKTAMEHTGDMKVDRIICAGDHTGYGPYPSDVCEFLEAKKIQSIKGNYDCKVLSYLEAGKSAISDLEKKKRELVVWTAKHLTGAAAHFLAGLPDAIEEEIVPGLLLLVVHGSPISNDDDILPSITGKAIKTKLGKADPGILVCGHTHIPFAKRVGGILIINCGSLGHPVDGDPRPSYALLNVGPAKTNCHIVRFRYPVSETVAALKKTSLPRGLQRDFVEGTKRRFV